MTAPIALFVYKRLDHARLTMEALRANPLAADSDLFIFSDAPRNSAAFDEVASVRNYVRSSEGFRSVTVIERDRNYGVDASVIDGVTTLCDRFGEVIVLEDDLVTSPWFLTYMNESLSRYRNQARVMQIGGFMFPINADPSAASFLPYVTSWGWATWKRAWDRFDAEATLYPKLRANKTLRRRFNLDEAYDYFGLLEAYVKGVVSAWDIRWYATVFEAGGVALCPNRSLVQNIGFDGSGVHGTAADHFDNTLATAPIVSFPQVAIDDGVKQAMEHFLRARRYKPSLVTRARRLARRLIDATTAVPPQKGISGPPSR